MSDEPFETPEPVLDRKMRRMSSNIVDRDERFNQFIDRLEGVADKLFPNGINPPTFPMPGSFEPPKQKMVEHPDLSLVKGIIGLLEGVPINEAMSALQVAQVLIQQQTMYQY